MAVIQNILPDLASALGDVMRVMRRRGTPRAPRLVYAADVRCPCGAGMAYDSRGESGGARGYWECSAILLGTAIPSGDPGAVRHEAKLPFVFYEIKSEHQPSAHGATTRPRES